MGGGGVFAREAAGVLDSDVTDNTTEGVGGGLAALSLIAIGNTFDGNRAGTNGGGLAVLGATTILFSSITNNESDLDGGGITIGQIDSPLIFGGDKTALISNSTISGNKAGRNGGGIEVIGDIVQLIPPTEGLAQGANLVANNVTIANNTSDSNNDGSGDGGGIWNTPSAAFGDFDTERFIWIPADVSFENSIIAGNFDTPNNNGPGFISPDISGAAKGNANNLLGDDRGLTIETRVASASESLGAGTDLRNIDPRLEELQDNGGVGLTHDLMPDSPAINGGDNARILRETLIDVDGDGVGQVLNFDNNSNTNNAPIPYDQRFLTFNRVVGGTIDIGALEVQDIISGNETLATLTEANTDTLLNEDLTFV